MSNSEIEGKVFNFFKDFMTRVTVFDELVSAGSSFLVGFQQGLELMRRPPIDRTSELVKNIIRANETKRVQSYIEAGCINTDDGMKNISKLHTCQLGLSDHITKGKGILNELECLLEDVNGVLQTAMGDFADRLNEEATTDAKEEIASSQPERIDVTDYAVLMGIIYSMIKQDYMMQERVVSALNIKSSSGEFESYSLMWSLRPFINFEIMDHAWKLIR